MNTVNLLPGVRQDHLGRLYQIMLAPDGTAHTLYVAAPKLSEKTQAELEPVIVESLAYSLAKDANPQNAKQAARLQRILDAGPTYRSLACFQSRNH